ncbi:MAG: glycoside hydrolase TIM-barrel-like domain-containing protein [Paracoccaceae bacterium]
MATILLAAAGASIGAGFGGSVLGLSGAVIGRAVGATLGRVIDQRLMGSGSQAVETGKIDRFRLTGASEGAPIGQVWGRMRVSGQLIWASRFREHRKTTGGGGKGTPATPEVTEHSYSVSLAIGLCEGVITRVGRVWADGAEVSPRDLTMRVYPGSEDQLPDPKIEAVEGAGMAPAYRGVAYVVFEDLPLAQFGNRVPQFSFEVFRAAQGRLIDAADDLTRGVKGVALIPGTGEYALATKPVHYAKGIGRNVSANVHSPMGGTDFVNSLESLNEELPGCGSVSLVVSWFGDDLRCGQCQLRPKIEDGTVDGVEMPWRAGGIERSSAEEVVRDAKGRLIYGGTPADRAVVEAIQALRAAGKSVVLYPFILMEQIDGNRLPDPWTGAEDQPVLPWRGRMTLSVAPGREGSPDRSASAESEVAAFFGAATADDFAASGATISYSGPAEWSYRRFILHYAHLCAAAGGVDAFCIGSEMRGLTQIRGAGDVFPAVSALRTLAADVRAILGAGTKIGYAADWSEYYGYQDGSGDLFYHLDPLWADANIDFIGIDNYMPLSDWRDDRDHADAGWGSIYRLDYLQSNIEGGEGYDWYYANSAHKAAQIRTPVTDGAYGEDWVWRYKDIRNWWLNEHSDRVGGVKGVKSDWVPQSKPIWFTEFGCAAVDKGSNEPNRFIDVKSSESSLPAFSNGRRDDLMQMQYLRAVIDYWNCPGRNPTSEIYGGAMVDMDRAHAWAWDSRPFPQFPGNIELWSDGENYSRGHWMNGRATAQPLSSVVAEICERSGVADIDVSKLHGIVRGYLVADVGTARAALQPLMLAYGFDAVERDGILRFRMRDGLVSAVVGENDLAVGEHGDGRVETVRATGAEIAGRVRLNYAEAEGDYETRSAEAIFPDESARGVAQSDLPVVMTRSEGQRIVERWLSEARIARDGARFALPPSLGHIGAGDVVALGPDANEHYRIDRVERAGAIELEAVRVESSVYVASDEVEEKPAARNYDPPVPVFPLFLDLPLMRGTETPHQPHIAVTATPWPGSAALYSSDADAGYVLNRLIPAAAAIGQTETLMASARAGVWDRGAPLRVRMSGGILSSVSPAQLLNGANLMAIGDGGSDNWELFQFAEAILVGPDTYDLSIRLRGQAGTDAVMPASWPTGSYVVLMDGAPEQIDLAVAERDLTRHYRLGPSRRSYDDGSFTHMVRAFRGIGLRPLSPVHLRASRRGGGDLLLSWIRRARMDGDSWSGLDVPLGETRELYALRVLKDGAVLREVTVPETNWHYAAALQAADGIASTFDIQVAQLSESFGPGPFARITINV